MLCNPFICLSVCLSVCFMSLGKNDGHRKGPKRLYLPKFMSLITFKWRQIELWSLLNRLGVLETWVLVSRRLETRFYKSWSRSWSWNPRVLVLILVLDPSSLGLDLGLGTWDSDAFKELHPLLKSSLCLSPLLLWNGYLATVVCWCGQIGLEWATTCWHSRSTCDATISCKFSCCCKVVISL